MKKFLFTLFALLVTGTAYAAGARGYMYMPDTVLTADQLGKNILMPVYVVLDNEYMNGFQCKYTYPDKIQGRSIVRNSSVLVIKDAILDSLGHTADDLYDPALDFEGTGPAYAQITVSGNASNCLGIGPAANGFWDPDGDGEYEPYGSVKLGPNGKFLLYYIVITPAADFTDGYITMKWMWSGGADARNGQGSISTGDPTVDNGFTTLMVHVTVKQDNPAPAATITSDGNMVTAAVYDDEGNVVEREVELYIVTLDDEGNEVSRTPVENPYTATQTYEDQELYFVAVTKANDGETEDTETDPTKIVIPAKEKDYAPVPVFREADGKVYAEREGYTVVLMINGVEVDNPYTLPAATYEDQVINFTAYTKKNGEYYDSETVEYTATVKAKDKDYAPVPTFREADGKVYAEREGYTVVLMIGDEEVDNPYTLPAATYEDQEITFTAYTKKNSEYYDSETVEYTATVKAKDKDYAPAPVFREADGKVYAEREGYTVVLMIGDEVVDNPYTLPAATYEDQVITFTAYTKKNNEYYDSETVEYTATVKAKDKDYAPVPTIALSEDNKQVEATAPEGYEVVMMKDGVACDNPYILPEASTEQETVLNFSAYTVKKTEYGDSETVPYTVTIAIKPTITFTPVENGVKVNILNFTEYTIKVNGTTVDSRAGTGELVVEKGDEVKVIDVYAKNAPDGKVPAEATDQYTLAAKKVYPVKNPTIDVTNDAANQTTIITITAEEGDITYTLTDDQGNVIPATAYTAVEDEDGNVTITIPNGNEVQFVTVTATTTMDTPEGYDDVKPGEAERIVEVPAYQQTKAPTIDVSFGGDTGSHYANVTFVNNDDASAVIEYSLDGGEHWNTYTPGVPVVVTTYGENTVLARATATGKATSEVTERTFTLDDDATSVNELTNGKTVAGVRYFNMAGQEMQEANGITIVVTTYTDGTTSAVKVIK